jgi:hypothetical protein
MEFAERPGDTEVDARTPGELVKPLTVEAEQVTDVIGAPKRRRRLLSFDSADDRSRR